MSLTTIRNKRENTWKCSNGSQSNFKACKRVVLSWRKCLLPNQEKEKKNEKKKKRKKTVICWNMVFTIPQHNKSLSRWTEGNQTVLSLAFKLVEPKTTRQCLVNPKFVLHCTRNTRPNWCLWRAHPTKQKRNIKWHIENDKLRAAWQLCIELLANGAKMWRAQRVFRWSCRWAITFLGFNLPGWWLSDYFLQRRYTYDGPL